MKGMAKYQKPAALSKTLSRRHIDQYLRIDRQNQRDESIAAAEIAHSRHQKADFQTTAHRVGTNENSR